MWKGLFGERNNTTGSESNPQLVIFLLHVLSLFPAEKVAAAADLGPNPCSAWPCLQSFVSHNDWPVISIAWHCPNDRTKQLWLSKMEYPRPLRDLTIKHEDFPALLHPQRVAGNITHRKAEHMECLSTVGQLGTSFNAKRVFSVVEIPQYFNRKIITWRAIHHGAQISFKDLPQ